MKNYHLHLNTLNLGNMDKLTLAADREEQGGCHWLKGSDFPQTQRTD